MSIQINSVDGRLCVEGDMTVFTAAEMKPALTDALTAGKAIRKLDLSQVSEFDSAGLQLVLAVLRGPTTPDRPIALVTASRAVLDVLELMHQTHLLALSDSAGRAP
jgi:anti-sigma B factor antagonist